MHFSLSDTVTSSEPGASERLERSAHRNASVIGRTHRDGLIRGLLFIAAISLPLGLAIATGYAGHHHPSAGYAQAFDTPR